MGSGNQRNKDCPCGSGKKFKRCCMNKKPRQSRIAFRPREPASQTRFRFSADGSIVIEGEKGPIEVDVWSSSTGYERNKGFKAINKIPMENHFRIEHPDIHLFNYDNFFLVDTNTVTIEGTRVSASCAMTGTSEASPLDTGVEIIFNFVPIEYYEFRNLGEKSEVIAWWFLLQSLQRRRMFSLEKRFAIIVDSEMGSLEDINYQRRPVFKRDYLPSNCRLLYASSDVGKMDYGLNQMFSKCDKEAGKFASYLRNVYLDSGFPGESVASPFFRCWSHGLASDRQWTPDEPIRLANPKEVDPRIFL